ncbi:MAG TPA: hypothetical protein VG916_13285 [Gemmatimonadaceae bacterium]|nr:hypothetical protein [Gemmatimonadaceae bacterium]
MADFFPRHSIAWRIEEPRALRRLTLSLPQMALVTGIGMRLWRSYVLTHGSADSWAWVGGTFLLGVAFLFGMCAIHLANFTLRNWTWRAPMFAVMEAGSEIVTSLALTTLNLEPLGAEKADFSDWLPTGMRILSLRLVGIVLFTLVLGVVVSILRRIILKAEHRGHTVTAVHRATSEHPAGDAPQGGTP